MCWQRMFSLFVDSGRRLPNDHILRPELYAVSMRVAWNCTYIRSLS